MIKGLNELGVADRIPVKRLLEKARQYQAAVDHRLYEKMPKFSRDYWWNSSLNMKVKMEPTRKGFGQALAEHGDDERVICLGLDISGSITISEFYASHPKRKNRWLSMGIAEQSATSVAAGLAKEGKLPVFGTYATFAAARNLDQIRTSICYGNFQRDDRRCAWRGFRRPRWCDPPGARRPLPNVWPAQYDRGCAL